MASEKPNDVKLDETSHNVEDTADLAKVETSEHDNLKITPTTLHHDEAMKVLAQEHGEDTWDPAEEKTLVRKIDRRLLWVLCITYCLQYYDKAMISQAAIFGIQTDLGLVGIKYTLASAILYVGFFVGSYPCSLLAQIFPIEIVASGLVGIWGVVLMLTVVCTNYKGLWAQRVILGVLEGGISPIFMLIVGGWYTKREQALRMGVWWCFSGYAGSISPLVNYGVGQIKGSLSSWKYMYLVAGSITILWSLVVFFFLPPDPIRARNFSARERYIAVSRLRSNNSGVRNIHWKSVQVVEALTDLKFWLMFFIGFFAMIGNGAYSTMTPIIVNSFGFNSLSSLLLTIPTGAIIGTIELSVSFIAYKSTNIRTVLMIACQVPVFVAAVLLWRLPRSKVGGLLFALYSIPSFGGTYCVALGLTLANCAGYTKRTVYAAGIFTGYCAGNIAGPLSFNASDAPVYAPAFVFLLVSSLVTMGLTLNYRYVCIRDNRKRDESGTLEAFDHAFEDDLTDKKNPQFRYSY